MTKKNNDDFRRYSKKVKKNSFSQIKFLWLENVKLYSKPNTIIKYEGILKNHLCALDEIELTNLDRQDIYFFTQSLVAKGLSIKTINNILMVLNSILKYAREEYEIDIPTAKYLKDDKTPIRFLSLFEQKLFINYLCRDMDIHKFGTLLAMYTGIRIGELCALKWEDIDENCIYITKTMMRINDENGGTKVILAPPKSRSSVRIIPFPQELKKYTKQFKNDGYLLSNNKLKYTEPRLLQTKFEKYVQDCNLKGVTFHTLRHTFATRCIEAGVDAKTVSELLGHADTRITLNRYVHSSFELKQDSIKKMQKFIG